MDLEKVGRNLLKIKMPHLRQGIQDQKSKSFSELCKSYARAAQQRDELRASAKRDDNLEAKYNSACDDLELDVQQYLLTCHIN